MAAQSEGGAAASAPLALGALLLDRGAITKQQLNDALRHQQASGGALGTILVELGYANAATIAQALATQHGGLLKTEYGFATGFGSMPRHDGPINEPPISSYVTPPPVRLVAVGETPRVNEQPPPAEPGPVQAAGEPAPSGADSEAELVRARDELKRLHAEEVARVAGLEREVADLRAAVASAHDAAADPANAELRDVLARWQAAHGELERRLGEAGGQLEALRGELTMRDTTIEELRTSASKAHTERAELERALEAETARAGSLETQHEAAEQQRLHLTEAAEEMRREIKQRLAELETLSSELETQIAAGGTLRAELTASMQAQETLEQHLQDARAQLLAAETTRATLEAQLAQAPETAAELATLRAEADALREAGLASKHLAHELEGRLAIVEAELEQRRTELATLLRASELASWSRAEAHLIFFQGTEGYELIEREGVPPAPGTTVEVPTLGPQIVQRVARSPFPGSALPCAYLIPA